MVPSSFLPQVPDNARMLVDPCNSFLLVVPSETTRKKENKKQNTKKEIQNASELTDEKKYQDVNRQTKNPHLYI